MPPTDPSSGHMHDHHSTGEKSHRISNSYVEVVGRSYADEKYPTRKLSNENIDDKQQQTVNKPRAKVIKGNQIIFIYLEVRPNSFYEYPLSDVRVLVNGLNRPTKIGEPEL